jgi:2,4-dienoyl-CoA reductase-like NADH-dependent reductase (Old Yellow Enzyme family)
MSAVAKPLILPGGAILSNRLCKAAMTEGLADEWNRATIRHERLYRRWSEGGAGLLITGNVTVDRHHPERPGNVAIDNNGGLAALSAYARAATAGGNHCWLQLTHAGRQTPRIVNAHPLAPSAIRVELPDGPGFGFGEPVAMTEEDILDVIARFARAAEIAREAGFTGVQIHAAHGYLLSSFLNPLANDRTDAWGGSLENRARLLLLVVEAVRKAVGKDFPVAVKLNSSDFQKGGFTDAECARVVEWLNDSSIDLLELSGGNIEQPKMVGLTIENGALLQMRESTLRREAYFLEYTVKIRQIARMPLMVTGGFRTLAAMNEAIENDELDVIGIGRPLIVDPEVPRRLLNGEISIASTQDSQLHPRLAISWFYRQLHRLGAGEQPDLTLDGAAALQSHVQAEQEAAKGLRWA